MIFHLHKSMIIIVLTHWNKWNTLNVNQIILGFGAQLVVSVSNVRPYLGWWVTYSPRTLFGVWLTFLNIYIYYRYIDIIYIKSHILSYMGQCLHLVIKCILFGNLFHICWSHGPFSFISDYPLFKLVIFNNYVE